MAPTTTRPPASRSSPSPAPGSSSRAKRSALFIFHGAEERGLLGSRYYVAHPIVPLAQIAAVLNGDMIGRNHPDTAALMGSQPPHRNSIELVRMAIDANRATEVRHRFVVGPSHASRGVVLPQRPRALRRAERAVAVLLDQSAFRLPHAARRARKHRLSQAHPHDQVDVYLTGWIAANAAKRPAVDSGFVLR